MVSTPKHRKPEDRESYEERKKERLEEQNKIKWVPADHHCGICNQPTSHPNTLSSCLPSHQEVCKMFHTTLHFKDKANECDTCRQTEESRHARHRAITDAIYLAANPDSKQETPSKRPEVMVTSKDVDRVARVIDQVFYHHIPGNVDAQDNAVEDASKCLRDKKWKPTKEEAEHCPNARSGGDNASLRKHAQVCAAFGLELSDTGGKAKVHADAIRTFWSLVKEARGQSETEEQLASKRKVGYMEWSGSNWRDGLPKEMQDI